MLDADDLDVPTHIALALVDADFRPVQMPPWLGRTGAYTRPVGKASVLLVRADGEPGPITAWTIPVRLVIARPAGSLMPPASMEFCHLAQAIHFCAILERTIRESHETAYAAE